MSIPLSYNLRNLKARRLTTVLTVSGMALVVFVLASILMMAEGLRKTLVDTGSYENAVVLRKGSSSEVMSWIYRQQASVVETSPEIATEAGGKRLVAKEVVVLITLPKRESKRSSNVVLRGIGENSLLLRPQVRLVAGRLPRIGSLEIIAGSSVAKRFGGIGVGQSLSFGMNDWKIVGIFEAGNTGFDSEIWGDADSFMAAFRRPVFSSMILKLRDPSEFPRLKLRLEGDPRLTLMAKRETIYYAEQSEMMAKFLRILGFTLTIIFSVGAMIGAMITMYSAVASRIAEIGTLRALGFQRRNILAAFLVESLLLGGLGGLLGLGCSSFLRLFTISTMNFQTFSELAFRFALTPKIALQSLAFSLFMGLVGGLLPAVRASRMNIVEALRAG
jgi:ABC-type antimicrobial peptide transport system permease subunit